MAKNNHTPSPAASDVVVIRNYPASLIHDQRFDLWKINYRNYGILNAFSYGK